MFFYTDRIQHGFNLKLLVFLLFVNSIPNITEVPKFILIKLYE